MSSTQSHSYPPDLVGYGQQPPHPHWPENAKIAVQFVINYEEGGENCVLHGDRASEAFLSEMIGAKPLAGVRNISIVVFLDGQDVQRLSPDSWTTFNKNQTFGSVDESTLRTTGILTTGILTTTTNPYLFRPTEYVTADLRL